MSKQSKQVNAVKEFLGRVAFEDTTLAKMAGIPVSAVGDARKGTASDEHMKALLQLQDQLDQRWAQDNR